MKPLLIPLATLLSAVLLVAPASAAITIVETGHTYSTLQAALDAVECLQTITLSNGTYPETDLYFGQKDLVTIKAASTSNPNVTITGVGSGCFAAFVCTGLTIENIKFMNGDATDSSSPPSFGRGGGLYFYECRNVVLEGCEISSNDADFGGGLYAEHSDITMVDCVCSHNSAIEGGGMYFWYTSVFAPGISFQYNNASHNGGGLMCDSGSYFAASYPSGPAYITFNTAGNKGGGMYVDYDATIEIADAPLMWGNTAVEGDQGYIESAQGKAYMQEQTFYDPDLWAGDHLPEELSEQDLPRIRASYGDRPETLSILVMPDRSGTCFNEAFLYGGNGTGDATITVYGLEPGGARTDVWLSFRSSGSHNLFIAPSSGNPSPAKIFADADFDEYGRAVFTLPVQGGGHSEYQFGKVTVTTLWPYQQLDDWMPIYFNSPDITGNGLVDLADYTLFTQDYFDPGNYHYRSDFNFDQVVDLADLAVLANSYCSFFVPEVPDNEVSCEITCD